MKLNGLIFAIMVVICVYPARAAKVFDVELKDETLGADGVVIIDRNASHQMTFKDNDVAITTLAALKGGSNAGAALTVASSTSADSAAADYVCDGTADDVEIQQAIDALTAGGTVRLLEGAFNLAASLVMDDGINVVGDGIGSTSLVITAANIRAFEFNPGAGNTDDNMTLSNFTIDCSGQASSGSHGGGFYSTDSGHVDHLLIERVQFIGHATNTGNHFFYFVGGGTREDIWIRNCSATTSAASTYIINLSDDAARVLITENEFNSGTNAAFPTIQIEGGVQDFLISNNTLRAAAGESIMVSNSVDGSIIGNVIDAMATTGSWAIEVRWKDTTGPTPSENIIISGNVIRDGWGGVRLDRDDTNDAAPDTITVAGNLFHNLVEGIDANEVTLAMIYGNQFEGVITPYQAGGSTTLDTFNVRGAAVLGAGLAVGANIVSDTDSTDDLGTTAIRWLNGWFDTLTAGTVVLSTNNIDTASGTNDSLRLQADGTGEIVIADDVENHLAGSNDLGKVGLEFLTVRTYNIEGQQNDNLEIKADTDVIIQVDADNDGTEDILFLDGAGTETGRVEEDGDLVMAKDVQAAAFLAGDRIRDDGDANLFLSFDDAGNDTTISAGDDIILAATSTVARIDANGLTMEAATGDISLKEGAGDSGRFLWEQDADRITFSEGFEDSQAYADANFHEVWDFAPGLGTEGTIHCEATLTIKMPVGNESAAYRVAALFEIVAGSVQIVGSSTTVYAIEDDAAWDVQWAETVSNEISLEFKANSESETAHVSGVVWINHADE